MGLIWSRESIARELKKLNNELNKKGISGRERRNLLKMKKKSLEKETRETEKWCQNIRSYCDQLEWNKLT